MNQEQFLLRIVTMINTFLLLEALVNGMKGTKKYVLQKNSSSHLRLGSSGYRKDL